MTLEEKRRKKREYMQKWRSKNKGHYTDYQREYKRKIRSEALREKLKKVKPFNINYEKLESE